MIIKLFGILDIIAAVILIGLVFSLFKGVAVVISIYLVIKGLMFFSVAGVIDILSGILVMVAFFGFYSFFTWIAVLWLFQKGIRSLF